MNRRRIELVLFEDNERDAQVQVLIELLQKKRAQVRWGDRWPLHF